MVLGSEIMTGSSEVSFQRDALSMVDLARYPIDDLTGEKGQAFLRAAQEHMAEQGWCSFDGFLRPEAVAALAEEANRLLPGAEALTIKRTIYGGKARSGAAQGAPSQREYIHHALQLADDQIPDETLVRRLYLSDQLTDFIRQVERKARLFRSADAFQALNIVALPPGCWHGWHYDHDECVVTLLLQAAEDGGEFVFIPNSRTREHEDIEAVDRFLAGDMSVASTIGRSAGTLTLFRGEYSLHGVSEVKGSLPRVTAIFTYDEEPGRVSTDDINIRIYGPRAARILAERRAAGRNRG